jgi:hypothetical protein
LPEKRGRGVFLFLPVILPRSVLQLVEIRKYTKFGGDLQGGIALSYHFGYPEGVVLLQQQGVFTFA